MERKFRFTLKVIILPNNTEGWYWEVSTHNNEVLSTTKNIPALNSLSKHDCRNELKYFAKDILAQIQHQEESQNQ